jgi:hypothetical protein
MARSSKPRKAYNPNKHVAHIPMMKNSRDSLALGLHMSIEALIAAPSIDTYNALSKKVMTMDGALGGNHSPIESAKGALNSVEARFQRVGKVGISPEEAEALRGASAGLDVLLAAIPVDVMQAAKHRTKLFCSVYGIE